MERWTKSKITKSKWRQKMAKYSATYVIKTNFWYRVFYSIGCVAYFSGCLYQSWSFLAIYFEYPTTIEVNVFQEPIIRFPAITVCNGNRVRKSVWCHFDSSVCDPIPTDVKEVQEYITKLQNAYKYLNRSIRILMGPQKEDFIRSCQFEDLSCMDIIGQYFNYEYTNCFTINGRWANKSAVPLSSSMFRPRTGRSSELSLMMNVQAEEYSPINPVVRARLTIHSPDTVPNPQYDGVSLQPGRTYNYGIRKNIVNVLPSPYQTNCKNYTGLKELRTNATMTQEDCMSQCCSQYHLEYCGCTVHRLSLIYDIRTCWAPKEEKCLKEKDQLVKDLCYPQCGMPCSKVTYSYISVDSFALQQGVCYDEELYNRTLSDENRTSLICLKVYFSSAESEIYSHQPRYNGIQVFSILGGYIGLWLGISFLDLHSYVMSYLFRCLVKKKEKNHNVRSFEKILRHNTYG